MIAGITVRELRLSICCNSWTIGRSSSGDIEEISAATLPISTENLGGSLRRALRDWALILGIFVILIHHDDWIKKPQYIISGFPNIINNLRRCCWSRGNKIEKHSIRWPKQSRCTRQLLNKFNNMQRSLIMKVPQRIRFNFMSCWASLSTWGWISVQLKQQQCTCVEI